MKTLRKNILTTIGVLVLTPILVACGTGFQIAEMDSKELLGSLSPYLPDEDQKLAEEVSKEYTEPIAIRENPFNGHSVEIETSGKIADLEIINSGGTAFRFNGIDISLKDLTNKDFLESIISNLLMNKQEGGVSSTLFGTASSHAFVEYLPLIFRLVSTGIYYFFLKDKGLQIFENDNDPANYSESTQPSDYSDPWSTAFPSADPFTSVVFGETSSYSGDGTGNSLDSTETVSESTNQSPASVFSSCSLFCHLAKFVFTEFL